MYIVHDMLSAFEDEHDAKPETLVDTNFTSDADAFDNLCNISDQQQSPEPSEHDVLNEIEAKLATNHIATHFSICPPRVSCESHFSQHDPGLKDFCRADK